MGGSSGALDSVVSTENGRSVLLSSGAPLGHGLHNLRQMLGDGSDARNKLESVDIELSNLFLDDEDVAAPPVPPRTLDGTGKLEDYSFGQLRHQVEASHA